MRAIAVMLLLLAACAPPSTAPRPARPLQIGSWALSTADDVCAALVAHVPERDRAGRPLGCTHASLTTDATSPLPLTITRITGARRPLAYLVFAPTDGSRRVLAEFRGEHGMAFAAEVAPAAPWYGDIRLIQVTTTWRGIRTARGSKQLTLCLAQPPRNDMNFPVCAFTTLVERWAYTDFIGGTDSVPPTPIGRRDAWAVAIDRTYGAALVVQVRGPRDPSVPTGAFLVQPPWW